MRPKAGPERQACNPSNTMRGERACHSGDFTMASRGSLRSILRSRGSLTELLSVAVILGLAVNLLATAVWDAIPKWSSWVLAGVLVAGSSVYLWLRRFGNRRIRRKFQGVVFVDPNTRMPMSVEGYRLAEELERLCEAAFKENPALKAQWNEHPLDRTVELDEKKLRGDAHVDRGASGLLHELISYIILDRISTCLVDYFNLRKSPRDKLVTLERKDAPSLLADNRFFALFSAPMADRPLWKRFPQNRHVERVVMAMQDGLHFSRFDLVLPEGSAVKSGTRGRVELRTPHFEISIRPRFHATITTVSRAFLKHYLNVNAQTWKVECTINVRIYWRTALWTRRSPMILWLDEMIGSVERLFSFPHFVQRSHWNTIETLLALQVPPSSEVRARRGN